MAGARKSLFRFAILILIIPVGLLLVLHFFGENRMEIPVLGTMQSCRLQQGKIHVLMSGDSLTNPQRNQLQRIDKTLKSKGLMLDQSPRSCLGDSLAIFIVDKEQQLRGSYELEQTDINRMFMELDILLMNEQYGEGISR